MASRGAGGGTDVMGEKQIYAARNSISQNSIVNEEVHVANAAGQDISDMAWTTLASDLGAPNSREGEGLSGSGPPGIIVQGLICLGIYISLNLYESKKLQKNLLWAENLVKLGVENIIFKITIR